MNFETLQKIKMLFMDGGYELSFLEIKSMTKISSDTDDETDCIYAIYKNDNIHLVHIKETDSLCGGNSIGTKTVKMYE